MTLDCSHRPKAGLVLGGKNRDREVLPAPMMRPFYCNSDGGTWRGEHHLTSRGWYIVTRSGALRGPFQSKTLAATWFRDEEAKRPIVEGEPA